MGFPNQPLNTKWYMYHYFLSLTPKKTLVKNSLKPYVLYYAIRVAVCFFLL